MNAPSRPRATQPPAMQAAPLISDWIRFLPERRILVLSGRVELGQGNLTAILQIAADELDAPVAAMTITGADTTRTPNEGFTSGSLSISQGGLAVRIAASAARRRLLAEAGRLLQCPPDDLSVEEGRVLRSGVATPFDLWDLAARADLDAPAAQYAAPKRPEERRLCGTSLPRLDLAARLSGGFFVHDMAPEGLLHGRVAHPPSLRSRLGDFDLDALRARPGVVAAVRDGAFLGVVAETEADAVAAARWAAARAEWVDDAAAPADAVDAIRRSGGTAEVVHDAGDVDGVVGRMFEATVTRPYLSHASIGPSAAVAEWRDGRLRVWSHAQGPYPLRAALADVFAIAPEAIEVAHRPGAGCYGHNGADDAALDAALLARATPGRPVKLVWDRATEFRCAPLGPGMATRVRAVVGADGRVAAMEVVANSAPHGNRPGRNGAPNLRAAAYLEKPFPTPRSGDVPLSSGGGADRNAVPAYAIPNLRIAKRVVHELPYRTSSLRALGGFANVYAIETMMDRIARELGEDPVAFRLAHLDDPRARAVVEAAVAEAAEARARPAREGAGWGLGFARYKNTAAYCAVTARIEVDEAIRVTDVFVALDAGEIVNPDGAINQTEGGVIQAISWTLKEAVRFEGAAVATQSWSDYPILTFSETPEVCVRLIDRPEAPALGCAEAAQGPTAAAIGNALRDAIGVHVADLPLTRDAIIAGLRLAQ